MTALESALALGLPCFPCRANKWPATRHGHLEATSDPAALRALWRRCPGPLVGVRTGQASGLSVLDIDGPRHPEAEAWFTVHRPRLPVTRVDRAQSGGLHIVFQHAPGVRNTQSRLAAGVDTRGDGGYVIWWPAAGCPLVCDAPPAPWPQGLLLGLISPPPPPPAAADVNSATCPSFYERTLLPGLVRLVGRAPTGERNSRLYWAACRLGQAVRAGQIDAAFGAATLVYAAARAGLGEIEARRTIASAFRMTTS